MIGALCQSLRVEFIGHHRWPALVLAPVLDRTLRLGVPLVGTFLALYLSWPYVTLWRLEAALRDPNPLSLQAFVDLAAVRGELKRKLNKETASTLGPLSDPFIYWIEKGVRTLGSEAIDRLVTLEWVRQCLLAPGSRGADPELLARLTQSRFETLDDFRFQLAPPRPHPMKVHLHLKDFSWRITAIYY